MYFRTRFSSFKEFQRVAFDYGGRELGKEEYELLDELEAADDFYKRPASRRRRRREWE